MGGQVERLSWGQTLWGKSAPSERAVGIARRGQGFWLGKPARILL